MPDDDNESGIQVYKIGHTPQAFAIMNKIYGVAENSLEVQNQEKQPRLTFIDDYYM